MPKTRNCTTCAHRLGLRRHFWRCQATGYACIVEARHGGPCSTPEAFALWKRRESLARRFVTLFAGGRDANS